MTVFCILFLLICASFYLSPNLQITAWTERETELRDYLEYSPYLTHAIVFAIYVIATGLSLPGAAVLSLFIGWYLGFSRGLILVSFASTSGATLAFLSSRYLFRQKIIDRYGEKISTINQHLERDGAFYLFSLRLIPAIPFFLINLLMGLTPIKVRTYWWVSQVGMLPGTAAYIYAGSSLPDLSSINQSETSSILTPQLIAAFIVLGLFPWLAKFAIRTFRRSNDSDVG
ncbi:MAG: TVP38/TMEM64 family protein [Rubripirellula sp.]|nr:TVP38/TMEM64 family protein [Rubripirellula sp.]